MNSIQKEACRAIVNVFETGKVRGEYGAVTVIRGDTGHLSYGRSQVSLGSGNLFRLLDLYCTQEGALFAADIKPFLPRFQAIDVTLDTDDVVTKLLIRAGKEDPVMRGTQDAFFNRKFLAPAFAAAEAFGLTLPLACSVVYDSHVQGGWKILSARIPPASGLEEKAWVNRYIRIRRDWLAGGKPPLPATVYRMDSFQTLATDGNWDLKLPFRVHGVMITEESLTGGEPALAGETARLLQLTTPYLRGDDVKALEKALGVPQDGVYGPFAEALVKRWQKTKGIDENGVGPLTRKSLNLDQASKAAVQP